MIEAKGTLTTLLQQEREGLCLKRSRRVPYSAWEEKKGEKKLFFFSVSLCIAATGRGSIVQGKWIIGSRKEERDGNSFYFSV